MTEWLLIIWLSTHKETKYQFERFRTEVACNIVREKAIEMRFQSDYQFNWVDERLSPDKVDERRARARAYLNKMTECIELK